MSNTTKKIRIDSDLLRQASEAAVRGGYPSVREFIEHAIEKRIEELVDGTDMEEQKTVEERLRGLGYIS
jgi:hypothetical protein